MDGHERERRLGRKLDHIRLALETEDDTRYSGFSDVHLIHRAIPEMDLDDVRLRTEIWGRDIPSPFFVDAMTGGPAETGGINRALGSAARAAGWGMAVGSQSAILDGGGDLSASYAAGSFDSTTLLMANLPASAGPRAALEAVNAIGADAIQLHLNALQELLMPEGDRCFAGTLDAIAATVEASPVPVMVKEVGCGIAREDAVTLGRLGVAGINVAGSGGTSFAEIELLRGEAIGGTPDTVDRDSFTGWGLPTAASVVECADAVCGLDPRPLIAAGGGVRTPLDAVKALSLGAGAVSIATPALRILMNSGPDELVKYLVAFNEDVRRFMLLVGAMSPHRLGEVPFVVGGFLKDWLSGRRLPTSRPL